MVPLKALGLVDRHHRDRVPVTGVGLGQILLALLEQPQVVDEGRQTGHTFDGSEALGQVQEAQQVLLASRTDRRPQPGPLRHQLGQVDHGQSPCRQRQCIPLPDEVAQACPRPWARGRRWPSHRRRRRPG